VSMGRKAEGFELANASAATRAAKSLNFEMSMTSTAFPDVVKSTGVYDLTNNRALVTMDTGQMLPEADGQMQVLTAGSTMYMMFPELPDMPAELVGTWVRIDLAAITADETGVDISQLMNSGGDPTQALTMLETPEGATDLGFEELDGVKVKHFQVVTDYRSELEAQGAIIDPAKLDEMLDKMGTTTNTDVWVDEQSRIRQVEYSIDLSQINPAMGQLTYTVRYLDFGTAPPIELPAEGDVIDFADAMGL
jgi:hypothetical protein